MNSALMERPIMLSCSHGAWPAPYTVQAAVLTVLLHAAALALLLANWAVPVPPTVDAGRMSMQLLSLPPAPVAPVVVPEEMPAPAAPATISTPALEPTPDPRIEQRRLEQARLARKRMEEQKRAEQRRQQLEREALARLQEQRELEQQRVAEAQRQQVAAAEQARRAATAAAASRSYQPIAKQAPAYPQRALDKGIEGQCTVRYTVSPQGRVERPEALDDCHPLFVRPSLAAAQRFRYRPRVVDGRAVAVPNVKNTFTYRIE